MTQLKLVNVTVQKDGKRRATYLLNPGDEVLVLLADRHYRLGDPIDDVVPTHVIANAVEVAWCPVEQKWVS